MDELVTESNVIGNELRSQGVIDKACSISTVGMAWKHAYIPYEINGATNLTAINGAIEYINKFTPLNLAKRIDEVNYVSFVQGSGNSSRVGMVGGEQYIRISSNAICGTVVHELFHAAGLWHEQSRADRDSYVIIEYVNISDPNKVHNFNQHIADGKMLGQYDYDSIMH